MNYPGKVRIPPFSPLITCRQGSHDHHQLVPMRKVLKLSQTSYDWICRNVKHIQSSTILMDSL